MAFIEYDDLNSGAQYNAFRFGVMKAVWGAQKDAYLDMNEVASIGTHLDLTVSLGDFQVIAKQVLEDRYSASLARQLWDVVDDETYTTDGALRKALDDVLADNHVSGHFSFADEQHMKLALNGLSTTMFAESMLTWNDQSLPPSEERAVVFSIAYEGADISKILDAMLSLDPNTPPDRFRAWFEIRYDSNNNSSEASVTECAATAARRYVQSDIFELYNDPGNVGYDEAHDVALGYQQNRQDILAYEDKYDPEALAGAQAAKAGVGNIGGNINDALQPAIAAITKHFGITTGHLDEVLFAQGGSPNFDGDGTGFDSKKNDDDLLIGDSENNTITGNVGNDVILGLAGNDDLTGGADNDKLYGYSGKDLLIGALGNDRIDGGAGNDRAEGGDGNDWLGGGTGNDKLDGGAGNDTLLGGDNDDRLAGGDGKDKIDAGAGNDTVSGDDGNDRIDGLDGKDTLDGGTGDDTLSGGNDDDQLTGDAGNDRLDGGDGIDTLIGALGDDHVDGGAGNDRLDGDDGDDWLYGNAGNDKLDGADGNDTLLGGNDDDQLTGGAGKDRIDAGAGNDTASGDDGNDRIDGLDGRDKLDGGTGDDTLSGGNDDDRLTGDAGNDRLDGGDGIDTLIGALGDDHVDGGAGNDRLEGDDGDDWLYGNAGNDKLDGGDGNDTLNGGNDDDQLTGGAGDDQINAGYGDDTADGNDGDDRINGLDGRDKLDGGTGDDTLLGGNDADRLSGGAGDDRLDGGGGIDVLIGGAGNDTYILSSNQPDKTHPDPDPDPDDPDPSLAGGNNADQIVEDRHGGIDTAIIGTAGTFDIRNVEKLQLSGNISGNVSVMLNEFKSFDLSDKADTLTLTIDKLQKDAIQIATGGGADTLRIELAPGIDPSQVLDHKGLTARFDFSDLTANDTIDLTSIGIKKIVTDDLDITQDSGFYLMAPDAKIHLMHNGNETKTYNNDTDSWFVVKCGDDTPYGPEFFGHVSKENFDI